MKWSHSISRDYLSWDTQVERDNVPLPVYKPAPGCQPSPRPPPPTRQWWPLAAGRDTIYMYGKSMLHLGNDTTCARRPHHVTTHARSAAKRGEGMAARQEYARLSSGSRGTYEIFFYLRFEYTFLTDLDLAHVVVCFPSFNPQQRCP